MKVGALEAESFWTEFWSKLNRHGPRGVRLVVIDSHECLKVAAAKVKAIRQHCVEWTPFAIP